MPLDFEAGVFARDPAWHRAGITVPPELTQDGFLTIEQVFEAEPLLASEVVQEPIFVGGLPVEGWLANVRELDGKVLGIVSSRYRVLQNRDAFAFASDLIDTGGAVIETAGLLRGGRWSWFLLRLPEEVMIGGDRDERLVTYLLIANSFDGTMSVTVAIVTVRVVCSNTLSLALDTAQRTFRVQHTGSLDGRLAEARRALEISFRYREEMRTVGEGLLARSVSDSEFERFLAELVPVPEKEGRGRTMALRRQEEVRHIYRNSEDLANVRGTGWGVLQAVAEWDTHVAPVRSADPRRVGERRLERVLMAQTLAGRAFELLAA